MLMSIYNIEKIIIIKLNIFCHLYIVTCLYACVLRRFMIYLLRKFQEYKNTVLLIIVIMLYFSSPEFIHHT